MQTSIVEFETVQDLATLLQVQVIAYTETHFPVSMFQDVQGLTPVTLVPVIEIIHNSQAAKSNRESNGILSTLSSWGKKATSTVGITHSPVEFHRLEQMLYFAEKAKRLKDLIKTLLNSDSIAVIDQTEHSLVAEITELFQTTERLTTNDYNTKITASVDTTTRVLDGMKGGFSKSTFAENLTKEILKKYASKLTTITDDIHKNVQLIRSKKSANTVSSLDAKLADTIQAKAELELLKDSYANMARVFRRNELAMKLDAHQAEKNRFQLQQLDAALAAKIAECAKHEAENRDMQVQLQNAAKTAPENSVVSKLHLAVLENDLSRVKEFLTVQNANSAKQGFTPLYFAIFGLEPPYTLRKDVNNEIVELLLSYGADPNEDLTDICNCSFLHAVIFQRMPNPNYPYGLRPEKQLNYKLIELLLRHGASVTALPSDEPDYKHNIAEPNIPGLINNQNNTSTLAILLREFKQPKAHTRP
ncbi:MAG: ankyrin repeat domain-containing protein [Pseudomonadota bacterium]|nr:ankyrin repeat domain-containing protein [Pseudomonadota bacterium]